jgi:hypothetical protein
MGTGVASMITCSIEGDVLNMGYVLARESLSSSFKVQCVLWKRGRLPPPLVHCPVQCPCPSASGPLHRAPFHPSPALLLEYLPHRSSTQTAGVRVCRHPERSHAALWTSSPVYEGRPGSGALPLRNAPALGPSSLQNTCLPACSGGVLEAEPKTGTI